MSRPVRSRRSIRSLIALLDTQSSPAQSGIMLSSVLLTLIASTLLGAEVSTQQPQPQPTVLFQDAAPAAQASKGDAGAATPEAADFKQGPKAKWIWGEDPNQVYFLRKRFNTDSKSAKLIASADNQMDVWLNGKRVAGSDSWEQPVMVDVSSALKPGANELLAKVQNAGGVSGFALKLVAGEQVIVSDAAWRAATERDAAGWTGVTVHGAMGVRPWGDVFASPAAPALASAAPRGVFQVRPGFEVELLYDVPRNEQGSWVAMTFDDQGRIIASDQGGKGLYRITPPKIGSSEATRVEKLDVPMTSAQGLLYAFNSLYVSVNGGPGSGFYRLRDSNGDDQYDQVEKLKAFRGGGEHGPHAVRLSPDGKSLYVIAGNHTDAPEHDARRMAAPWDEDLLLPRQWDARGHARGKLAPGGWIAKTDPEGKRWELVSIGYRNPYDMDFNADGELFAYDADMEWDMGAPWYRPTRVVHATSGSEFGWRSGTGKWPTYYPDSLPPAVDIGPGSPVGVTFGYGTKFPPKYQRALYILDWTFGTIYAIHLTPQGASYVGEKEEFLSRTPLPLTDAAVGPDGALYFTIGGRNTQSALYRVTYSGDKSTAPVSTKDEAFADLRGLRRELESLHRGDADPDEAISTALTNLRHDDRHIRYAARTALEHQDVDRWRSLVLQLEQPNAVIEGVIALARMGVPSDQPQALGALGKLNFDDLNQFQKLSLLRAYGLVFLRLKPADAATAAELARRFDPHFPADNDPLNRELAQLLVYVKSPTIVSKVVKLLQDETEGEAREIPDLLSRNQGYGGTIAKMLTNMADQQKLYYAFVLRNMKYGWTLEERKAYFNYLTEARTKSGGASFQGFIDNIRKEALANATDAEREALAGEAAPAPPPESALPKPIGPGRPWTVDQIVQLAESKLHGRDLQAGRRAFAAAKCVSCHRFAGSGGATGPDLTNTAGRFSLKDLAESIVEPSRTISDQYRASILVTTGGKVYTGRVLDKNDQQVQMLIDPVDVTKVITVPADEIDTLEPSKTSLMPADTVNQLNEQELLDLLAYLLSRGDPNSPVFQ